MVAIFVGLGAGFERGSGASLGARGLLGSGVQGRAGEGVSLNAATGNLILTQQDEFLAGLGPDVAIGRTYNSSGALNENGDNWRQSTDRRVYNLTGTVNTAGSTITRVSADGSEIVYTYNATTGVYTTTDGAGAYDKLAYASGDWTWTDGSSQYTETYLAADGGFISRFSDTDGNTLTFTYVSGKLDKITSQNGEYVQYSWSGSDITAIVTHFGTSSQITRATYAYDAQHRLTTVTVDLTPDNTSDSSTYTTTYTYVGTTNLIASITQTDGSSLTVSYDGSNRVTDLVQLAASGDNRTTHITYVSSTRTDVTDPRGQVTSLYYNASGQLTQVTAPPAYTGATAQTVQYVYDTSGNLTSVTDPTNAVTTYTYDANGNVATITDPNTNVVTRSYDAKNALILETRTASTSSSSSTSVYTRYIYDAEDHLRYAISAEGRVSEYRYDTAGNLQYSIDYPDSAYTSIAPPTLPTEAQMNSWVSGLSDRSNTEICKYVYDARGDLTQSTHYGAASSAGVEGTSEGYAQTLYVYDQAGRLLQRTQGPQTTESFVYDGLGRLTSSIDLNGGTTTIAFNDASTTTTITTASGYTTVSTYNKAGNLVSRVDSGAYVTGGTETFLYDKTGQLRKTTDATGYNSYVLYDKVGRKIADIGHGGQVVEYRYDQDGRLAATVRYQNLLTSTQLTSLSDPNSEIEIASIRPAAHSYDVWQWNVYDAGGRTIETIMGDGSATQYEYDASNRLVKTTGFYNKLTTTQVNGFMTTAPTALTLPTADAAHDSVTRSFHDGDGRLIGALNAQNFVSKIIYDSAGRKVQTIAYANATTSAAPATDTFATILASVSVDATKDISTRYVYDGQGLLRFTVDALSHVTELVYRQSDDSYAIGLVRKTIEYATALGSVANYNYATIKSAVAALAGANDRVSYAVYNNKGQLAYAIDAVGAVTNYLYDNEGRVTKATGFAALYTSNLSAVADSAWASTLDTWASSNGTNARITRSYYSARGEARFVIDAEGYVTRNDYDQEGRLFTKYRFATALAPTDAWTIDTVSNADKGASVLSSYRYDALGRLQDVYDPNGVRHTTFYWGTGLVAYRIEAYAQGADEARTIYFYDQGGKLTDIRRDNSEAGNASSVGATATQLNGAQMLISANGQYRMMLTREGELRVFHNGDLIWTNGVRETVTGATYRLVAQTDGNLVVYRDVTGQSSVGIWSSNTAGSYSGATFIVMQDDGNFVFAKGTAPTSQGTIWSSGTTGVVSPNPDAAWYELTHYNYDGLGNQISILDFKGATTSFTYDKVGHLLTKTDPLSGLTQYQYDAFGDVVKTVDARGNSSFGYYDQAGRLVLTVDGENYATSTNYSAFSEVQSVTRYVTKVAGTPVVGTQPTITTNAADETTSFAYDKLSRLTQTTDAAGGVEDYGLNAFGQRISFTNKGNGTARATVTYAYDKRGLLTSEILPIEARRADGTLEASSVTNTYAYDWRGNRITMTEAAGLTEERVTTYQYDAGDRLTDVIGEAVLVTSSAISGTSSISPTTHYDYDRRGNVIAVTDANGYKTFSWYDKLDRLIETVSPLGALATYFYDKNSNLTEKRVYATLITPPANANGAPPFPSGSYRVNKYTYDALNRVTQVKIPSIEIASYTTSFGVATQDLITTTQYDAMGNVLKVTDANGNSTWSYYDKLGRKIAQFDGLNYRTDWTYDADGNVLSEKRYANAGTSGGSSAPVTAGVLPANLPTLDATNDRTTTFTYDKMGRRLTETRANVVVHNAASPGTTLTVNSTITYTYNALGEVATKTEASSDATSYAYDASGRMLSETHASFTGYTTSGSHSVTPVTSYSYDGLNDLVRTVQTGDAAANASDRITQYAYGAGGRLASVTDAENFTHTYQYDAAGRVTRDEYFRQLPNGTTSHEAQATQYDSEGRVVRQGVVVDPANTNSWSHAGTAIDTTSIQYNAFGEVSARGLVHFSSGDTVSNEMLPESFVYDGAGRLWRTTSGDGTTKYFMYDAAGNQTLMVGSTGTDISVGAGYSTIDSILNLWGATRANIGTNFVAGIVATITRYDARNQAIEVKEPQRELNATTKSNLSTTRAYNAFGEVAYEINALAARVDYTYNTMGRLIQTQSPTVAITSATGSVSNVRPTENYYYDASGRRVAARDANSNLTQYTLLAGSGYNGMDALVAQTKFADNYTVTNSYDIFGDARKITDELSRVKTQTFDKMGRLLEIDKLVDTTNYFKQYFRYDGFGQQIYQWNNQLLNTATPTSTDLAGTKVERTYYDAQGRITETDAMGGDATTYAYAWDAAIATSGLATFGGWTQTTTLANGKVRTDKTDYFKRTVNSSDYGAHVGTYAFDKAGRLISRNGGWILNLTYFNTGRLASEYQTSYGDPSGDGEHFDSELRTVAFGYDTVGNLLTEKFTDVGNYYTWQLMGPPGEQEIHYFNHNYSYTFENATATYDALGRLATWNEAGSTEVPIASAAYYYDANGNVRRSNVVTRTIDGNGVATTTNVTQDYWYKYDSRNRIVTAKGILSGGAISRGTTGVDILYDAAGQRATSYTAIAGGLTRREDYTYDNGGRLTQVKSVDGSGNPAPPTVTRGSYTYDWMGRVTAEYNYQSTGALAYSRADTFNDKGQVTNEESHVVRSGVDYKAVSTYTYGSGATYALGAPLTITTVNYENSVQKKTNLSTNTYVWWDGAMQQQVDYTPDTSVPGTVNHSFYNYSNNGGDPFWYGVNIVDGRPRQIAYRTDLNGQVIRRDETDGNTGAGDPHEIWYRFGGKQLAYVGNNNTITTDYVTSINNRTAAQGTGAFMNGASSMTLSTDTDQGYDPINSYDSGQVEGGYTVQAGDTLSSIAAQLWGDASLWYKIAEVNGFSGDESLVAGTILMIPPGVVRSTYTAATFTPYDPNDVIGNTAPTAVKPPKGKSCGLAQVFIAVIAVVVAVVTAGAGLAAIGAAANVGAGIGAILGGGLLSAVGGSPLIAAGIGAVAGAAGSIVSQGIAVATGIQDKFSWSAVGLAAIGGGIAAGGGTFGINGDSWGAAAARGAISDALTQGIGVATGLQDNFSWAAVAGAAVGAGIGFAAGKALNLGGVADRFGTASLQYATMSAATSGAAAIANAASRSLIDGSDFGDNVLAAIPDVIGQTIGNAIAGGIAGRGRTLYAEDARGRGLYAQNGGQTNDASGYDDEIVVTARNPLEWLWDQAQFAAGALWGFAENTVQGIGSLLDFGVRDLGGSVLHAINIGIDSIFPNYITDARPDPYAQSWADVVNVGNTAGHLIDRTLGGHLIDDIVVAYRRQDDLSSRQNSPFDRGRTNPAGQIFLNVVTAPLAITKVRSLAVVGDVADAARGIDVATDAARAADAAADTARVAEAFASTDAVIISGRRATDLGRSYEAGVRGLYPEVALEARRFRVLEDGRWVTREADSVAMIGGQRTAIDAKFVDDWATSLRNPANREPWALAEQQSMLAQAQRYSSAFEGGVVYHTNSVDLATHYSQVFRNAGITNFEFFITPATRR